MIQDRFDQALAALGPFERAPILAVAVSGGSDSLALALLADRWARAQGGGIVALTIDHRLRSESGAEAAQVGRWLAARSIPHRILPWREAEAGPGLQAAAREARYRLLCGWCRDNRILHLLLGHQREDQAETLMLRLARGSGVDGLAAMAASAAHADLQILRPLLDFPREELRDFLRSQGQDWIDDPSNQSERFDRVRWRALLAGIPADRLALTARQLGRARQTLEAGTAALAAESVILSPAGFARLDPIGLRAAPDEIALRLVAALARTVGGGVFPPRLGSLEKLLAGLDRRRTFAGCVFTPEGGGILIQREAAKMAAPVRSDSGVEILWDNRFLLRQKGGEGLFWGGLGPDAAPGFRDAAKSAGIPRSVLPTLPALVDKHGILAVPPLGWFRAETGPTIERWGFAPVFPLAGAGFRLVTASARII